MGQRYPVLDESTYDGGEKEWTHDKCNTVLLVASVGHSIHNGAGPLGGFGEVYTETVPYCPACQSKPAPCGIPLKENPVEVSERKVLRRMRENRNKRFLA